MFTLSCQHDILIQGKVACKHRCDMTPCFLAGVRGFGQGLLARTLTIAPGAALQWFIYERVKLRLALMDT